MEQSKLNEILGLHKKWLNDEEGGKRANLQWANLQEANLQWANLQEANLQEANLQWANLRGADLRWADLHEANLRGADLQGADLRGADLRGANLREADLDFACWPLWCGSLNVKVDKRIAAQLAYHFYRLDCDDPDYIAARNAIVDFANTFHRVKECGRIEKK